MLSYRSTDSSFVQRVADYLRGRGIDPWIGREGIKPGTKWRDELLAELRETCA